MANPPPVVCTAPAKINLFLHVAGKRDDGYHFLDSLVVFAGAHDTLTFEAADRLELHIDGPFAASLLGGDNLVLRAARSLAGIAGIKPEAAITLTKRLPVSSGMGGGSTDAAATLRGLCQLWNLNPTAAEISALALDLGADVPVCLHGKASFMGGIGDVITPAPPLPPCSLVLLNIGAGLSTPAVFAARRAEFSPAGQFDNEPADAAELAAILASRTNDLEAPARRLLPAIGEALDALEKTDGVLLSRMTGSGATCFGLYATPREADAAAMAVGRTHPDWWVTATSLESDITTITPPV